MSYFLFISMCCPTTTPTITTITKRKGKIVKRGNDLHKHIVKVNKHKLRCNKLYIAPHDTLVWTVLRRFNNAY